jgi:hypothetical protein
VPATAAPVLRKSRREAPDDELEFDGALPGTIDGALTGTLERGLESVMVLDLLE